MLGRDPVTGKYKQHWENVKGTKADAERRLAELQNDIFKGIYVKPHKITVAEYLIDWLENTASMQISPTTYKGYKYIIDRHLIPGIGKIYLSNLNGIAIQKYYAQKLKAPRMDGNGTLSARSVRSHHRVLHRALKSAITKGLLAHNAADNTEPPMPVNKEIHPMTEEQLAHFLQQLRGSPYYEMFYLCLFTALRRSELLALRWEDIDLQAGQMAVSRAMHYINREYIFREPKTAQSKATISLTPSTITLMDDYKQRRSAEGILLGVELQESDLVFCHIDGSPLQPNTITKYWQRFVVRIGMPNIRLHDARHTHATLLIKNGVNSKLVQEHLRHSRIETTLGIYTHVTPGMHDKAAAQFDRFAP